MYNLYYHKKTIYSLLLLMFSASVCFAQKEKDLFRKAEEKLANDDAKGAIKLLDNAIKIKPDYVDALYNRGTAKLSLGDFAGAIADFDAVLKLNPDFTVALYNRAAAKGKLKNFDGALEDVEKVVELRPSYGKAYALRGQIKKNLKDKGGACEDFRMALEFGDKSVEQTFRILCNDGGKIKIVVKKEDITIPWPDSVKWKPAPENLVGANSTQLLLLSGQTIDNFTIKGSQEKQRAVVNQQPQNIMQHLYDEAKQKTPAARLTLLDAESKTETPWAFFSIETPDKKEGSQLIYVMQGNSMLFITRLIFPAPALDEDLKKNWGDVFREAKAEYK